jgi:ATP-dependent exoDNAse (exonuclease V) beta subunit
MEIQHISPSFQIYNASAGSGKTFLLVQKYLETLLGGQQDGFHRMLALTFTNKAVFEMKFRILKQLHAFASNENDLLNDPMAINIMRSLSIDVPLLRKRARNSMQLILHDYAAFDVITLDSFTHRVIRSFAKDLGLSYNFNVSLQVEMMLQDTVDSLLNAVGEEEEITSTLENYTFDKMEEEGTSWDIKQSLFLAAKLLLNENDRKEIKAIAQLSDVQKRSQQQFIVNKNKDLKKRLMAKGKVVIDQLNANGLSVKDFSYGTLYKRFLKLSEGELKGFELGKLHQNLQEGKGIYPTKIAEDKKQLIEQLLPTLLAQYEEALQNYYVWLLTNDIKKQWVPLRLLARLARQLEEKQKEDNTVLLSTFNERIAKEILAHPASFIYERLGENYRYYFLDEFQDTSNLQWNNLVPLIENALISQDVNGKTGELLLVGDPKQSIYRWRGGDVDQFIGLLGNDQPFPIEKEIVSLTTNYRSASQIVAFNNSLYTSLQGYLAYVENKLIFETAQQDSHVKEDGYVQLDVLSTEEIEEDKMAYPKKMLALIQACHAEGTPFGEMAVLVRKRKQAVELTQFLSTREIPVVSSDSLLIGNSSLVQFLLSFIQMHVKPSHLSFKKAHLDFLYTTKQRTIDQHDFVAKKMNQNLVAIWREEGVEFDLKRFELYSLYDVVEQLCFVFPKLATNEPFLQSFLDVLFDFCQSEYSSPAAFLDYWEKEGQRKALPMANVTFGVKVLTIHQAKGLEFPVVFFPYADQPIHPNIQQKIWLDTSSLFGEQFPLAWINLSKRLVHYGPAGEASYERIRREEEIDAWNTFYVATTRAVEQLYIVTKQPKKEAVSYAGFLEKFLLEQNKSIQDSTFSWGVKPAPKQLSKEKGTVPKAALAPMEKHPYEDRLIWQLEQTKDVDEAKDFGLLIHALFAQIDFAEDVDAVLNEAYYRGDFSSEDMELFTILFRKVVEHPDLKDYFSKNFRVLNEQTILLDKSNILRPDRIMMNDQQAVVLDYKTGAPKKEHLDQIKGYCQAVNQVTGKTTSGYLIYFSKNVKSKINLVKV